MSNVKFLTRAGVQQLTDSRTSENVIIFLSGPTSRGTPLSLLRNNDVITVNGAAEYLLSNGITPFIYVLTDARFLLQRREDFYKFSRGSKFTFVNMDVYEAASEEDKCYMRAHCFILRAFYKREKGGLFKKLKLETLSRWNKKLLINVPVSKRGRLVGFSKDISFGYCSCHTVAYTAMQIAYSLGYDNTICSGLDITGSCARFYDESNNPMPSELSKDLVKILPFFKFMRAQVPDFQIYNLSDDTAIGYDIIPFIRPADVATLAPKKSVLKKTLGLHDHADSYVG
ncbi:MULTISPECIES: 3-deoxy-D-manno-oct-2-ulosonate III transferase WaaZ [Citrobacter]|uniref:3-deoxy-D-manno-oct-2-ulosonate III transferase WaaZ n=1 Tax=Citrobacter TaxID=544 RepID=UPI00074241B1|nr:MULTISPECIES: 3-deoxy-D-manno-oct-2-ulosonate III transferase WaaZ [Citrobacter]EHG7581150.1 3-deoxy-D-manno-oct-2-ulosonate III transferase WaaZ [Citrobacter sedlakii]EIQ7157451.1 3-deoxy-D-manno-oct-2-ulosonate III transferase WaaZ [Citrobacter sedlakii]KSY28928.1 3-deoxy-D-manno-oct-2-ulosonate III transferase WaaZ [Citrobacter sp. 50677481]MBN6598473.1 3-deoxy-D-manno-oct-2-ulosonate III transferase WaaZ [Citrobacter sedlakii]MCZ4676755.1 3-deoxy-D-manno-oct-2-ulosonate III transferase 